MLNLCFFSKLLSNCFISLKVKKLTISDSFRCNRSWRPPKDPWPSIRQLRASFILGCLCFATVSITHAQTDQATSKPANLALQDKVRMFLEPERGLNNEIRAGLARLEQTCTFTNPSKSAVTNFNNSKSALIPKEIEQARKVAIDQQAITDKAIAEFRSVNALNSNACAALPPLLRVTDACVRYQKQTELVQTVSQASQSYFGETLARFKSYEAAVDLEARGCTRPEFAFKLWGAEQTHIVPKLLTSGQQLSNLLK